MYARPETRDQDFDRLVKTSYGLQPERPRRRRRRAVTMTADTGAEVIPQPADSVVAPDLTEYVVDREPITPPAPPEPVAPLAPVEPVAPPAVEAPPVAPAEPMPVPAPVPAEPMPVLPTDRPAEPLPVQPPAPVPAASEPALPAAANGPLTSQDLAADMRAILTGGGEYAAPASAAEPQPVPPAATASDPGRPMPDAPNEQSIFDRIAQSMEYANSFDLGTVDLQRRFEHFDRADAARRTQPAAATAPVARSMSVPAPATEADDSVFWRNLPAAALSTVALADGCAGGTPPLADERSVPMYDTGEHVMAGNNLYPDQLRVGTGSGVAFSYGQILSMADLYDTVGDLRNASPAELTALKTLIERDTAYYERRGGSSVSNKEWNDATGKRYLALADDNYSHFSPPSVLGMTNPSTKPDNKSTWERYHEQAIAEMRAIVAANPNASPSPFGPLTTNAFGDHFLTDAFAAGHLVNKELVLDRFRSTFYAPGTNTVSAAGAAFLQRLAAACWARKPVRDTFSPLEEVETRLLKHWNIDTENAFRKLLVGIAEQAPTKVQNLALKALHDHLNEVGVEVTNDAGDGTWTLKGDQYLTSSTTLPIMQRAVKQSIDNITGPEILVSEAPRGPLSLSSHPALLARVWKHVPKPTAAGRAAVTSAIATYTDLSSPVLLNKAAELVEKQSPFIAAELIDRRILQHE